jgi:hypothetical protein
VATQTTTELTEATAATVEILPVMITAASTTAAIMMMTIGAATIGIMITETTVVEGNSMMANEIAVMAITISVTISTTVTYVLASNSELWTARPTKPVVA